MNYPWLNELKTVVVMCYQDCAVEGLAVGLN